MGDVNEIPSEAACCQCTIKIWLDWSLENSTQVGVKRYPDISVHRDILCTIQYIDTNMKISIQNDTTLP